MLLHTNLRKLSCCPLVYIKNYTCYKVLKPLKTIEERKFMIWLISANSNIYEHSRSFSDNNFIDWKQGVTKYSINDIVYIYVTRPEQAIKYKCQVTRINLTGDEIRNDKEYWVNKDEYENSLSGHFIRLEFLKK